MLDMHFAPRGSVRQLCDMINVASCNPNPVWSHSPSLGFSDMGIMDGTLLGLSLGSDKPVRTMKLNLVPEPMVLAICHCIAHNAMLESTLRLCVIQTNMISPATGVALASSIAQHRSVEAFDFRIGDSVSGLMDSLKVDATIGKTFFFLVDGGYLDDTVGVAMAGALKKSQSLKSFSFHVPNQEAMGNKTGLAMAEALKGLATLEFVNSLESFSFTADGSGVDNETGKAFAEAVAQNPRLQSFSLSINNTKMDDETGQAMADAIKANEVLTCFEMHADGTGMGSESATAMGAALKENETLTAFVFEPDSEATEATVVTMKDALEENSTLKSISIVSS